MAKTFKLARIEIPDSVANVPAYDPTLPPPVEDARSIKEVFDSELRDLEALGWHVKASENSIALHSFFKNGNLQRTPGVQLSYEEFIVELVDASDELGILRRLMRPSRALEPTAACTCGTIRATLPPRLSA